MRQTNPAEVSSYAGSVVAVLSSLTLTDIGIIIGIVTALATFWLNTIYTRRKVEYMRRKEEWEAQEHAARMRLLEEAAHE